jgi:D-glycero-D-manno-heptose 1,7-bisphosphate phosphatase
MTGRPAVFLDRDGTLIEDRHYIRDANDVHLIDGVPNALARLRAAGYLLIVVTNQSGIARGWITPAQYAAVRDRLDQLLAAAGAPLDATYVCPHHPDVSGRPPHPCACRKPGLAMFVAAATDLKIDLARSVLVGDRWRDIAAAPRLGDGGRTRGILIPTAETPADEIARARESMTVARSLHEAADDIIALTGRAPER